MSEFRPSGVQQAIYARGLRGEKPAYPLTADGLEAAARAILSPEAFAYIAGSAGEERTAAANREAFERRRIVPRMMRGTARSDLSTTVLGKPMTFPVLAAPVGVLALAHRDGELAVARATAELDVVNVVSTAGSHTMEEIAAAAPAGRRWFQLYWPSDPELAESFVSRADAAGFGAIVVTLDTWSLGWRPRDLALAHLPFLGGNGIANYLADPFFRSKLRRPPEESPEAFAEAVMRWAAIFGNPSLGWDDLARLRAWTNLPIVVKGVLHPGDARAAVDAGADGIVVSNHGGRQLDRSIASLDALPAIVDAVGDRTSVLFDSGIRSGADVLVALAIGARAVFVGRPYAYGLAIGGADGVSHVFRTLLADFDSALALAGIGAVARLDRSALVAD